MFDGLDATLLAILDDPRGPAELRGADVSFETPNKDFTPNQPTINLFLYDVEENRVLRDNSPVMTSQGQSFTSQRAPIRIDCTYLVTTWSPRSGGLKPAEEHRLLGQAVGWLARFRKLEPDSALLQGDLATPPQPFAIVIAVAQMKGHQTLGQFWNALGIAPRPAFSLTATVAIDQSEPSQPIPAVRNVQVHGRLLDSPELRGVLVDGAGAPVAGVEVSVAEAHSLQQTSATGEFRFSGLPFGRYTLRVRVSDGVLVSRLVDYTAQPHVHTVRLL